ncbi:MAG: EAL domain-containing protein [Porticoccaceae bacterium]|nr:EAL domain-containing protein [Porticoccaceae bacterium]
MNDIFHVTGVGGAGSELSRALIAARLQGGVMVVDRNLRVVMIDRKAADFCQVSSGQSQGKRFYALFPVLLGSDFSGELHQIISASGTSSFQRPADNTLLDQFAEAFSRDSCSLLGVSMTAYDDGSNNYCLIRFSLQAATKNVIDRKPLSDTSALNSLGLKNGEESSTKSSTKPKSVELIDQQPEAFVVDKNSAYMIADQFGFISQISAAAETLFGYSSELLLGCSVRTLFPGLDEMQGLDLVENINTLAAQHSQGYILAATCHGESRYLDIKLFYSAADQDQLIILCNDCTQVSQQAEELINRGELYDLTSKHIADAVVLVDAEGFVLEMNPIAEQLLGLKLDKSKPVQIHTVMPLANEDTGIAETPVQDALNKALNVESNQSLLLKVRGAAPVSVSVSAFPLRDAMGRIVKCLVIFRPLSEARRVSSRLQWQSMHDSLTGLPNRASLSKHIQKAVEIARHEGATHALLYIDLYNFSVINDTSGHTAGDELLKEFAQLLIRLAGPSDITARIGNDEFALLIHRVNYDKSRMLAERILAEVKELRVPWEGEILKIGASIGAILIDNTALSDIDLMISAGSSCATARDKGRNKIHFQSFNEEVARRRSLATSMPKIVSALDEDRFTLFAQPIVPLQGSATTAKCYEVLVRMRESDGTILPPSEFIPGAEHFSLIDDLDKWVFSHSLKFLQRLQAQGSALPLLSVNLSGTTVGDENAIDYILRGFSDTGISPKQFQFEITETAAVKHLQEAKRLISTLRSVGVSIALDDFGSGLSSFAYLKELPIDCLKIDSSFIHTMENSDVDYSVVSTINHLGHIMGVTTVAEGVENENQLRLLKKIGVDYLQGFLFQHPQLLDQIRR